MTTHSIKVNRALRLSTIGAHPLSTDAMLAHIPPSIIETATARAIADLLDSLWRACQASKAIASRDACSEGAIWDARRQTLRETAV